MLKIEIHLNFVPVEIQLNKCRNQYMLRKIGRLTREQNVTTAASCCAWAIPADGFKLIRWLVSLLVNHDWSRDRRRSQRRSGDMRWQTSATMLLLLMYCRCPTRNSPHGIIFLYAREIPLGMLKPFFFGTGNRFAETGFLPVTERPIVSGIIVTGRSALAISQSLVASRRPWPTYQTHTVFFPLAKSYF